MNFRRLKMSILDNVEYESYIGSWPTEEDREWIAEACADAKTKTPEWCMEQFMIEKPSTVPTTGIFTIPRLFRQKTDNQRVFVVANIINIDAQHSVFLANAVHPDHRNQGHMTKYAREVWIWGQTNAWLNETIKDSVYPRVPAAGHSPHSKAYTAMKTNRGQVTLSSSVQDLYDEL